MSQHIHPPCKSQMEQFTKLVRHLGQFSFFTKITPQIKVTTVVVRHYIVVVNLTTILNANDINLSTSNQCFPTLNKYISTNFIFYQNCSEVRRTTVVVRYCLVVISLTMTLDANSKPSHTTQMSCHVIHFFTKIALR